MAEDATREAGDSSLLTLMAWLSPAYPVGTFAYSHGLERAIHDGQVRDAAGLADWIADLLEHGAGRTDALLLAAAWRGEAVADLAAALAPSAERLLETEAQGTAFAATTAAAWGGLETPVPYPVAVGRAAGERGLPLEVTLAAFLQAFVSTLVSAGIRLVPIGQTEGQRIIAALAPHCLSLARTAAGGALEDIGGCAILSDIASMRHETLTTRLFRS